MKRTFVLFILALSLALSVLALPNPSGMKKTIDNLQAAFNGESNAQARYLAFAVKAEAEGYGPAASLFRAAARAEQVHFEHHAAVIKAMGGTPKAEIEAPVVKSTKENLQASLQGETYEYTKMYPGFMVIAETEQVKDAVTSFQRASEAEAVHAKLYAGVLKNIESWKGAARTFYVCPTCGNVLDARPASFCPICGEAAAAFMAVK
jgi:rubrerythrin